MRSRSLSPTEARVILSLEEEGRDEVTLPELRRRARVSPEFARKLASTLVRDGWLQRLRPGRYLLNPVRNGPSVAPDADPLRFGSRLVAPYYFGYATAAELWGFLPQVGRVYFIATPRRVRLPRTGSAEFRPVHVDPRRFFGVRRLLRRGEPLVVSDPERTVLDCLARPELAGGLGGVTQILRSAHRHLHGPRLARYLRRYRSRSLELRLGFLLESLSLGPPGPGAWLAGLRPRPGEGYVPLGSPREYGRNGPQDPRWHITRNVPESVLRSELDIR